MPVFSEFHAADNEIPPLCLHCVFCYDPRHPDAPRSLDDRARECCYVELIDVPPQHVSYFRRTVVRRRLRSGVIDPSTPACSQFSAAEEYCPSVTKISAAMNRRYVILSNKARKLGNAPDDPVPPAYPPFFADCTACTHCRRLDELTEEGGTRDICTEGHIAGAFFAPGRGCKHFSPDPDFYGFPYVNKHEADAPPRRIAAPPAEVRD